MAGYIGEADILVGADASRFEAGLNKAVSSASKFVSSNLGQSLKDVGKMMENVGGKLTKGITVPALGAATAAAGITAAFGWKRLVAIDSAQAQLKGLGYSTEDVTRISGQLAKALEGGMLTMAEATNAAAAGMAAGVSEGKELTRYIQILDGAVAGSTGTFDEMNQIFARIQGSGKLMTNELQMIEQRMPGFTMTMANSLGVTQEELGKMVSAGEISSAEFLDIMEGFAGDMATEYAKSWAGMVQNTSAYIAILGQALLGGVFEKSKESIAQFIELLSSEQAQEWAAETGEAIGNAFARIVDAVTGAIQLFIKLPGPVKAFAGALALAVVSIGPLLLGIGKLISVGFQVVSAMQVASAALSGWRLAASSAQLSASSLTRATQAQTSAAYAGAVANNVWAAAVRLSRTAMTGLWASMKANPLGWILGALAAVTAALVFFFTQTETGRQVWANFMSAMEPVFEKLKSLGSVLMETAGNILSSLGPALTSVIGVLGDVFSGIGSVIAGVFEAITPLIQSAVSLWGETFSSLAPLMTPAVESISQSFSDLSETLGPLVPMFAEAGSQIVTAFAPVVEQITGELVPVFMELVASIIPPLISLFGMVAQVVVQVVAAIGPLIAQLIGQLVPVFVELVSSIVPLLVSVFSAIVSVVMQVVQAILPLVTTLISQLVPVIVNLATTIIPLLVQVFMSIIPVVIQVIAALMPLVTTIIATLIPVIQALLDIVVAVFSALAPIISAALNIVIGVINTIIGVLTGDWSRAWDGIKQILQGVWDLIKSIVMGAINIVWTTITSVMGAIIGSWGALWNRVKDIIIPHWNVIKSVVQTHINAVRNIISTVTSAIASLWSSVWNRVRSTFTSIWSSIVSAGRGFTSSVRSTFSSTMSFIGAIPSRIRGMFSGMGSLLIGSGRALINGFKQGIMNGFASVRSAVSSGLSNIRGLFPFSPAKEGPFSGRGWVEYGGESVGETFADSIAQSLSKGTRDVSRALDPISMEFNRPDFARTVIPLAEPARARGGAVSVRTDTMERPITVQGPLVSIEGGLTVDSDDRVRQLSQELWNRANRTSRAQGKVNLGGVVRQ